MAIIIDNEDFRLDNFAMADDGLGELIKIPSILIGKSDGEKLWQAVINSDSPISLLIEFSVTKVEKTQYSFWLDITAEQNYVLVREFDKIRKKLGDKAKFSPNYYFFPHVTKNFDNENCLGDGKYCCLDPDFSFGPITGRDIAFEQLR